MPYKSHADIEQMIDRAIRGNTLSPVDEDVMDILFALNDRITTLRDHNILTEFTEPKPQP